MTTAAPEFHQLTVASVEPLTDEAVALTFDVPDDLAGLYRYLPGQHVTDRQVAVERDGVRREVHLGDRRLQARLLDARVTEQETEQAVLSPRWWNDQRSRDGLAPVLYLPLVCFALDQLRPVQPNSPGF